MIKTNDLYLRMDTSIIPRNFWGIIIEEKKKLIDTELKKYILSKIQQLDEMVISKKDLSVPNLLQILSSNIPREKHIDILGQFTHYIIQVASTLQNYSITRWSEEDNLIQSPIIQFDENGLWINLETHKKTDYVKTFNFIYDTFNNKFMSEKSPKKLIVRLLKNGR